MSLRTGNGRAMTQVTDGITNMSSLYVIDVVWGFPSQPPTLIKLGVCVGIVTSDCSI